MDNFKYIYITEIKCWKRCNESMNGMYGHEGSPKKHLDKVSIYYYEPTALR